MRTIGNILFGLYLEDYWVDWHGFFTGCIWCITIIGIPVGLQCFKFATLGILAVWKRNRIWKWHVFVSGKSYMDYIFWMGNGTWKPDSWLYMVYYDSWNSIWKAVFQDGKTLFHAIWCESVIG